MKFIDERLAATKALKFLLEYVFPDHWSFLLGEIALYSFIVLVITGIFLALFFSANLDQVTYLGSYTPLHGQDVTAAYRSTVNLSFKVSAGLLMRQTHHWAALVFVAAIALHLLRIVLTGAFRKPREINYVIGVTMLGVAIFEGFCGYSLPDDLLSGMGLAIAWGVAMSLPLVGGAFATAVWDGRFPGSTAFESRLYIVHVFIIPAILATLIAIHLATIMIQHHSQFRGPGRRERNVVGTPMWPGYALRSLGLLFVVASVLVLLGGLIQVNPIWLWGPYHVYIGTNGAQPDWYLGWLIGALRIMPNLEVTVGSHTLIPNPFWGGAFFPTVVFIVLYAVPWIDKRFISRESVRHDLLDRPRDNPTRTALALAMFSWVLTVFAAGSADRLFFQFGFSYEGVIWFFRGAFFLVPPIVFFVTRAICRELAREQSHPLHGWTGRVTRRNAHGGFDVLTQPAAIDAKAPLDARMDE